MAGPASATSTPSLRGLRRLAVLTGTGLAHPMTPKEVSESNAGTIRVPTGSTWDTGLSVSRPARAAVLSPNILATHPCEISCKMIDGTTQQKTMMSCSVMLWWTTSATTKIAMAAIHRVRLVR